MLAVYLWKQEDNCIDNMHIWIFLSHIIALLNNVIAHHAGMLLAYETSNIQIPKQLKAFNPWALALTERKRNTEL